MKKIFKFLYDKNQSYNIQLKVKKFYGRNEGPLIQVLKLFVVCSQGVDVLNLDTRQVPHILGLVVQEIYTAWKKHLNLRWLPSD